VIGVGGAAGGGGGAPAAGWGVDKGANNSLPKPSLRSIIQEEQKEVQTQPKAAQPVSAASSGWNIGAASSSVKPTVASPSSNSGMKWQIPAASADNSSPSTKPTAKSLRDIMEEENAQRQIRAVENPKVNASSWAAKAGSSSHGGYSAILAAPTSKPAPNVPSSVAAVAATSTATSTSANKQVPSIVVEQPSSSSQKAAAKSSVSSSSTNNSTQSTSASSAGSGKKSSKSTGVDGLSADLAEWCSSQLVKINGNSDLTLVQFCASLESAAEIREYLAAYLGSTPQV
jgi:hypothetical protein